MLHWFNILLIFIYFLIVLIIGIRASRRETSEGYLLANRNVKTFTLTATITASLIGSNTIVTMVALIFVYGISVMWAQIGVTIGLFSLIFLVPKIKKLSDKYKFHTFPDYFYNKYGKRVGFLASIVTFIVYTGFLLIQFIAGGIILSSLTGLSYTLSVFLVGVVVIAYIAAAGFRAVIKTDVFQYLVVLLLVVVSASIFSQAKTIKPEYLNIFSAGPLTIAGFLIYGVFIILIGADMWQRVYAGKNEKVVKKSLFFSGILFLLLSGLILLIGLSVRSNFPNIVPETALVVGFTQILPQYLLGIGLVILFAAIMSSLDTFLFILSSSFSKDFLSKFKRFSKSDLVSKIRIFSVLIGVLGMILAIFLSSLINVLISIAAIYFSLFPALISSFWLRLKEKAVLSSITAGFLTPIIAFTFLGIRIEAAMICIPASLIFLFLGQLLFKR